MLRLDGNGAQFPCHRVRNSDGLEVGDLVLAIGDPFGVGQTVTSGIVSALARTKVGISDYQFFIQTDAAINPGNSGGALVDMDGQLVGINTAIFSKSGGSHGIGFAIPSNMVRLVVQSALTGGKVQRPWLGASLQPLTSDLAESLGLDRPAGAMVTRGACQGARARRRARGGRRRGQLSTAKIVQDPEALRVPVRHQGHRRHGRAWHCIATGKRFRTTIATVDSDRGPAARCARPDRRQSVCRQHASPIFPRR